MVRLILGVIYKNVGIANLLSISLVLYVVLFCIIIILWEEVALAATKGMIVIIIINYDNSNKNNK